MAVPDAVVWCIDGDGCFQMTNQELATCAIENIPIKVAIINNGNLGMVRQWQNLFYAERYSQTDLGTHKHRIPDFKLLAEAMGCVGLRCRVEGGRRPRHPRGHGDQRPTGRDRLRGRRRRAGVADGRRRHRQRPDHGRARHPAAVRRATSSWRARRRSTPSSRRPRRDAAPHPLGARREQARRARPRVGAVLAARLQHRVAGRRAHRARRRLPHDDRRRRRGLPPRAGHQAAQQAHPRPQDRGAGADASRCSARCCW